MEENLRACLPASLPFACPALTASRRVGLADTQIQIQLQSNSRRNKRRNYMHTYLWTCSPSAKLTLTTTMRIANNESFPLLLATQLNCFCMLFRCSSFCLSVSHSLCFRCLPPYRFCLTLRLFDIFVFCFAFYILYFYFTFISLLLFCFNSSLFAHNFSETCVRRQTNAWINTHWANDNEWMSEWVSGWVNEWMSEWMAVRGRGRWVNALFEKCKSQIQNTST